MIIIQIKGGIIMTLPFKCNTNNNFNDNYYHIINCKMYEEIRNDYFISHNATLFTKCRIDI